jgi:hypothetical protein
LGGIGPGGRGAWGEGGGGSGAQEKRERKTTGATKFVQTVPRFTDCPVRLGGPMGHKVFAASMKTIGHAADA